ncbi:MAG TPA: hypothetical protein VGM90_05660 [Kofleriaceae bacterium]|jgi:hypothetical protein
MDVLAQIDDAVALSRTDAAGARTELAQLWDSVGDDPLHRCAIAHAMADLQTSADDELMWDRRALAAGLLLDDDQLVSAGMAANVEHMLASLHLNLADVHRRLGNVDESRTHVVAATAALKAVSPDGYTEMIREALARISGRDHAN